MFWVKPNGTEIETNDNKATIEYCESLGWKEKVVRKPRQKKRVEVETNDNRD